MAREPVSRGWDGFADGEPGGAGIEEIGGGGGVVGEDDDGAVGPARVRARWRDSARSWLWRVGVQARRAEERVVGRSVPEARRRVWNRE